MIGLLGGALSGMGEAVQHGAQSALEERRVARLEEMRHRYRTIEQGREWERQDAHRTEDRQFAVEDRDARFSHDTALAEMRERGANQRSAAAIGARRSEGANDWQMIRTGEGLVQFSPSRNEYRPANLPAGAELGGDELSARDKYRLDDLSSQINAIRKRAGDEMRELTTEEKAELGRLQGQFDSLLGTGGGATPLERLLAGEDLSGGASAPGADEIPDGEDTPGLLGQAMDRRAARAAQRDSAARTKEIDEALASIVERVSRQHSPVANLPGIGPGVPGVGGRGLSEAEIQAAVDEIEAMRHEFTPRQEARAARLVDQLISMQQ